MRVQANFRALKFTFGLRLREKAKAVKRAKCFVPLSLEAKRNFFIYRIRLSHKGFPNHEWLFTQELLSGIFWYCLRRTSDKKQNLSRNPARFFLHSSFLFSWFIAPHFLTTFFTLRSRRLEVISESEIGVREGHTPPLFSSVPSCARFFLAPMLLASAC